MRQSLVQVGSKPNENYTSQIRTNEIKRTGSIMITSTTHTTSFNETIQATLLISQVIRMVNVFS